MNYRGNVITSQIRARFPVNVYAIKLQVYIAERDKVANQVRPILCLSVSSWQKVHLFFRMEKFSLGAFVEFLEQWKISG